MAHSVECLTLGFHLGYDPRVMGLNPMLGSALSMEPAEDSLSPLPLSPARSLSLKRKKKRENHKESKIHLKHLTVFIRK